jgi:hypothetical protein
MYKLSNKSPSLDKSLHGVIRDAFIEINAEGFDFLNFVNGYPAQVSIN